MERREELHRTGGTPERQRAGGPTEQAKQRVEQKTEQAKRKAEGMKNKAKSKARTTAEQQKRRVANGMDRVGQRLEQRGRSMEAQGGLRSRAGRMANRAGETVEQSADYLRTHEISTIRDDAEDQIREHPFASIGAALSGGLALGWLVGRVTGSDEKPERFERMEGRGRGHPGGEQERGTFGNLGRALMSGASTLAAREVRKRVSGERNR